MYFSNTFIDFGFRKKFIVHVFNLILLLTDRISKDYIKGC